MSMKMKSKSLAHLDEEVLQPAFAVGERDELDFGARQVAIGGNERQAFDHRGDDGERGVRRFGRQRVIDGACSSGP